MIKQNGLLYSPPPHPEVRVLAKRSWQTKFHVKFRLAYKTQAQECNVLGENSFCVDGLVVVEKVNYFLRLFDRQRFVLQCYW